MTEVLLFGGTTEGRLLARWLAGYPVHTVACVATQYGEELLPGETECLTVLTGRLDWEGMQALMERLGHPVVVDATHPYAVQATRNIRQAARAAGCVYYRLLRAASPLPEGCVTANSVAHAVSLLKEKDGPLLAATGSKEMAEYTALPGFARRVYLRILPTVQAVEQCVALGFLRDHIIAMQGPFSAQLNCALLLQTGAKTLVTKDGGAAGGFAQKVEGARMAGAGVIVVRRPGEEQGHSLEQLKEILSQQMEGG